MRKPYSTAVIYILDKMYAGQSLMYDTYNADNTRHYNVVAWLWSI